MKIEGRSWLRKAKVWLDQRGIMLMYHRVENLKHDPWQLAVSPAHFEEQMQVIQKYARPVQMCQMGKDLKKFLCGRREIVVTFDDGYADNFTKAKPILERYGIPATFFIVTSAIDKQEEFWWDELERIILDAVTLPGSFDLDIASIKYSWSIDPDKGKKLNASEGSNKIPANGSVLSRIGFYYALWQILGKLSFSGRQESLEQLRHWAQQSVNPRKAYLPMSSAELTSLSREPLFEIGAHTVRHANLSLLPVGEQEEEISSSKRDLEQILDQPVTSFSYPFGNYSTETPKLVERSKFLNACIGAKRPVTRNMNPYLMPRFGVNDWDGDQFEKNLQSWLS